MNQALPIPDSVSFRVELTPERRAVLTPAALKFLVELQRGFGGRLAALLAARQARQIEFALGIRPDFLESTRELRRAEWTVAPPPRDLLDRRVEITGPVERKMVINALNSGASAFMADFEDATAPTFDNLINGQSNLIDAVRRQMSFTAEGGKRYELVANPATLFVRPRGLHLPEKHVLVDGAALSGALFDFGLFLFHNASELRARGTAPYFYLPKLESHREARWWNDVFLFSEQALGLEAGTIRATVLIETLPAAFEMDEILYELRDHSAGLNCGRWDYIFSFIKKLSADPAALTPDRGQITMDRGFLRAYSELLIDTCHRRGAHAMGGMAAQIPIKNNPEANATALERVRADKLREVKAGHDGTWVAHPGLVSVARSIFDELMPSANQIHSRRPTNIGQRELLATPAGTRTAAGVRHNISVGIAYLEAWLGGNGCVPLHHLMEDAATAEICRSQIWQWVRHGAKLESGETVTRDAVSILIRAETEQLRRTSSPRGRDEHFAAASALFESLVFSDHFEDFLTLSAYDALLANGG